MSQGGGVEVYRSDDILVRVVDGFGAEACVVTFDSYADYRHLDRPGFGEAFFRSRGIDAIHVISRNNDWYQYPEMAAVAARIAAIVAGYRRVVSYGSSMGGYAAIRFGKAAGAATAIAISPQYSIDPAVMPQETRWSLDAARIDFAVERGAAGDFVEQAYILYDPYDPDRDHVERYRPHTRVVDIRLAHAGHPAGGFLAESGLLGPAVLDIIFARLDPAALAAQARAARKRTPNFLRVLSERTRWPRAKVELARRATTLAPGDPGYLAHYATVLAQQGRFDESEKIFATAMDIQPDNPVLLYRLSELQEWRGDLAQARATMEALAVLHPEAEVYLPRLEHIRARARKAARLGWGKWPALRRPGSGTVSPHPGPLARWWQGWRRGSATPSAPDQATRASSRLPVEIRVTTTPSPPPFIHSWQRHLALLAALPREPVDLFLVGDSLAQYWPESLWHPWTVANFGVAADKTQHALWRLAALAPGSLRARRLLVVLGTNNLGADDSAAGIAAGIAAVVEAALRVAPGARAHVLATPPCGPGLGFRDAVRRQSNRRLSQLRGFTAIDADAVLAADPAANYLEDGIHFSETGYRRLSEHLRAALA